MENSADLTAQKYFVPAKRSILRSLKIRGRKLIFRNSTHSPYLSMDSLANLADYYVFGKNGLEALDEVKAKISKIIFVNSDQIEKIDFKYFPNLKVVLAGNADRNFESIPDVPPSVNLLLLMACSINTTKVKTLPVGLENKRNGRYTVNEIFFRSIQNQEFKPKVLVPPMSNTNPIRGSAITEALKLNKIYDVQTEYLYEKKYLSLIKKYKFVLCLEGNCFESHRIWETLYLGVFPVMFRTKWSKGLEDLKLPIYYIDKLSDITPEKLLNFWDINKSFNPKNSPTLWLDYWKKLINDNLS